MDLQQRSRHGEIRHDQSEYILYLVCRPTGDRNWWEISTLERSPIVWLREEQTAYSIDQDLLVLSPEEWKP